MPGRTIAMAGALVLLVTTAAVPPVRAEGAIADGPAVFARPISSFDSSPLANFTGVSSDPMEDHVFEMGWWYRVQGDEAEKFLPQPTTEIYVGDIATLAWSDVDGRGFGADESDVVAHGGVDSGQVLFSLTLTNLSDDTELAIDVFHMMDVDLGGTSGTDSATLLVANERIALTDGPHFAQYGARGAGAFLVRPYDGTGLADVAGVLSNDTAEDFDGSGLPFLAGDITCGFQWTTTVIPAGGSATFVAGLAVNQPLGLPGDPTTTTTTSSTSTSAAPPDTVTSTSSSTTTTTSTSTTTLPPERCDNCADDDGDGRVDFEDPACCAAARNMVVRRASLRPRDDGGARLKLGATLPDGQLPGGPAPTEDVIIQLRGAGAQFCARIPAASFRRRRGRATFHDRQHGLASAQGLDAVLLLTRRRGATRLTLRGRDAALLLPGPGTLEVTLGLRDAARADAGHRCATSLPTLRATRNGLRYP